MDNACRGFRIGGLILNVLWWLSVASLLIPGQMVTPRDVLLVFIFARWFAKALMTAETWCH